MKRVLFVLAMTLLAACSSSETPVTVDDAAVDDAALDDAAAETGAVDSGLPEDTAIEVDSAADSALPETAAETSADAPSDTPSDASGCHALSFGAAAAPLTKVAMLPPMTGGTITAGTYDAVEAKTTGSITGSYRATWSFLAGMKLDAIEQVVLSAAPAPSVRSFTWSTTGVSLTRTINCGGTSSFTNNYTVRSEAAGTFLDVRQDTLMFTFKKR